MKKKIISLFTFITVFLLLPISVFADDNVKFSLSKDGDNLKPGNNFTVSIKSTGANDSDLSVSGYRLVLSYNTNSISLVSADGVNLSNINDSGGTVSIDSVNWSTTQTGAFDVGNIVFKINDGAPGGSENIKLEIGECQINGEKSDKCQANGVSYTVASYGTDASLSSLKIPNSTLKPAFSSDVMSYTTNVKDITSLNVQASPTDPNAKVQITDNYKNLQKGENKIDIVVTSEDGNNTKTYSIIATLEVTPSAEELLKADAKLKTLEIKGQTIDFDPNEKKYYITVPYETTELKITATPNNDKAKVTIENEKKLKVGKTTVKINVTSEDGKNKETYSILVTRNDQEKVIKNTCPPCKKVKEWIYYLIMLGTFTLGIVLGYILCKKDVLNKLFKKKEKKEEEPVELETLSDTIDISKTVEDIKKMEKKRK